MKFQTRFNPNIVEGEVNDMPSMSVPGQVQPLSELIRRLRSGMEAPLNNQEWEEEDNEIPFPVIKDLTDFDILKENYQKKQKKYAEHKQKLVDLKNKTDVKQNNADKSEPESV